MANRRPIRISLGTLALVLLFLCVLPPIASASNPGGRGSQLTLSQAPAGLQAAVRNTFGSRGGASGSPFQQAKLTASDGVAGDKLGDAVAIYGSTAVVGAKGANSGKGAAYVFVRSGTTWTQQAKLTASDAGAGDHFGASVAVAFSTVMIGAPDKNSGQGAVYVFSASGTTWDPVAKLTASDGARGDEFGESVAFNGGPLLIGAPGNNSGAGATYVFSASSWTQEAKLTAGVAGDHFGDSVSLADATAVIGADGTSSNRGAAYVFTMAPGGAWSQDAMLAPGDGAAGDFYGASVAVTQQLAGASVIVGAPYKNSGAGQVYVYSNTNVRWTLQAKLSAPSANSLFGWDVSASGPMLVVGAWKNSSNQGVAYVFTSFQEWIWPQESVLTASDGAQGDNLGAAVAMSGSTAVLGAPGSLSNTGAAYAFVVPSQQSIFRATNALGFGDSAALGSSTSVVGAPGTEGGRGAAYVYASQELSDPDGIKGDQFGYSVATYGSTVVIGAPGASSKAGSVYVFTCSGGTCTQEARLTASDSAIGDQFGSSVADYGSTLLVGAPGKNAGRGAAYVFVRSGAAWTQTAKFTPSDPTANDYFGYSVAMYSSTALIGTDNGSKPGATYVFVGSGTTWSQQAKLTASDRTDNDFFGGSVALYGSSALVGARNTSKAYLFTRSGTAWSQRTELLGPAGASSFGNAVALYGPVAVVTAARSDTGGSAYVYYGSNASWALQARLNPAFPAAALYGSTALFGFNGWAYVFGDL